MIAAIAVLLILATVVCFVIGAPLGVMASFIAKPVADAAWDTPLFGPVSPPRLAATLIPIMLFSRLLVDNKRISQTPLFGLWTTYMVYMSVTMTQVLIDKSPYTYFDQTFRLFNGYVGYLAIQAYFSDRTQFKRLLQIIFLASLFPLGAFIFQLATGTTWRYQTTATGLERLSGLYHDVAGQRIYLMLFMTALLLYWTIFLRKGRDILQKAALVGMAAVSLLSLYFTYSKAGTAIIVAWFLIWTVGRRSLAPALVLLPVILAVNIATDNKIGSDIERLFSKETTALSAEEGIGGEEDRKRAFAGRGYVWEHYLTVYSNLPLLQQIFGRGSAGAAHNDFLTILLVGGVIGTLLYLLLLISIGVRVTRNYLRERSPLNVMAVMLFTMWIIDSIGLVPSYYPNYQWLVWGIIGLSFRGIDGLSSGATPTPRTPPGPKQK